MSAITGFATKFRATNGSLLTTRLFRELSFGEEDRALFTLKRKDTNNLPSLFRLYMELNDPTEYEVATQLFESWEHWERITNNKQIQPYIAEMREELAKKLESEGVARLIKEVQTNGKNAYQAAKYLAERGWSSSPKPTKRGRPSKTDTKDTTPSTIDIDAHYALISGSVN